MARLRTRNRKEKEPTHRWHLESEVEEALRASGGFVTVAARLLGVSASAISQRIKKSEHLQEVIRNVIEENLSLAKSKLLQAVENNESWAIMYILRTLGKRYGFSESLQIEADLMIQDRVPRLNIILEKTDEEWSKMALEYHKRQPKGDDLKLEEAEEDARTEQIHEDDGGTHQVEVRRR